MLTNDGRQQHEQRVVCYSRGASQWDVGWRVEAFPRLTRGKLVRPSGASSCQVRQRQVRYGSGQHWRSGMQGNAPAAFCTYVQVMHILLHMYLQRTVRRQRNCHLILQVLRQP